MISDISRRTPSLSPILAVSISLSTSAMKASPVAADDLAIMIFFVLDNVNLLDTRLIQTIATQKVPQLLGHLEGTFLNTWKDGKVILLLEERSDLILFLILKTLLCLSFGLFFPFVHEESGHRILRRLGIHRGVSNR